MVTEVGKTVTRTIDLGKKEGTVSMQSAEYAPGQPMPDHITISFSTGGVPSLTLMEGSVSRFATLLDKHVKDDFLTPRQAGAALDHVANNLMDSLGQPTYERTGDPRSSDENAAHLRKDVLKIREVSNELIATGRADALHKFISSSAVAI